MPKQNNDEKQIENNLKLKKNIVLSPLHLHHLLNKNIVGNGN